MNLYQKLLISFLFVPAILISQEQNLAVKHIPQELKEYANAVIRLNEQTITIEDIDAMVVSGKRIVTVLNKAGDSYIKAAKGYDKDTKITKLSAIVYNAFGKQIKKYSKSKFEDASAVSGGTLYSDDRIKYLKYTPTSYPYTLVFNYEIKTRTTGFINSWYPVEGFSTSTEKSRYKIENPKNLVIRTKEKNFKDFPITNKSTNNLIHYELSNQPALKYEANAISRREILPNLMIGLNQFSLKGVEANIDTWNSFGQWMRSELYEDRLELTPETITKIKSLVQHTTDPIEKAKIVYNYVQNKTRYINVTIGIGGWQPALASEVDKLGYGDCKGLTNYTKALLDAVGVTSNWTVVYANSKRDIDKNFVSMQGNHMMLNIPNNGNDVWLECTSQTLPFGFLGDFTNDRDVLVLTESGGVIKHTPAYSNEFNEQKTEGTIHLDPKGNIKADVHIKSKGLQYDDRYYIEKLDSEEIDKYYKNRYWNYINNLNIEQYKFLNNKETVLFEENLKINIDNHGTLAGNDLLVGVNVFNKITYIPQKYRNRKLPLQIAQGFKDIDEIKFNLPKGYKITTLPALKKIETDFGSYEMHLEKINATQFIYHRTYALKSGIYPKQQYKVYREFIKTVNKTDNLRVAFSKK
ncbi:DUF3857 domain-containing protein [Flavicella sediminum]|uniref:DUF3857 domain-containing protein n=1 Tax=Flavicella sediminum TaxID=2585141 RepID=UPI001123E2CE|nr:DUF3857 domain-containing transglutaminase family protein [Flavicella sediminum]